MTVVLALLFTLVLAGVGGACVFALTRPGGFGSARAGPTGRGYARGGLYDAIGASPSPLFGGRRWATVGCYLGLALVIMFLLAIDGALLFLISVARS